MCPATARGGKQFVARRLENDRLLKTVLVPERDGHRKVRKAMQEIGGPVEWINNPDVIIPGLVTGFFCENPVVWVCHAHMTYDFIFRHTIDVAHIVFFDLD